VPQRWHGDRNRTVSPALSARGNALRQRSFTSRAVPACRPVCPTHAVRRTATNDSVKFAACTSCRRHAAHRREVI
jgi:hypothetical protein